MASALIEALRTIFNPNDPTAMFAIVLAAAYGLFVGAIPGLTATMAVALIVPITFFLDPVPALAAIVTLEATAIFAGDIPTTLVRIPGTPSSAAYTDDAYALTRRGEGSRSLGVSLVFSVFGGIVGAIVLMLAAPLLSQFAREFTSYEYFWLAVLGLSSAVIVSKGSFAKGLFALAVGLLISTIGLDEIHGVERLTFGSTELKGGIGFIPAMIGLFGMSEVLRNVTLAKAELVGAVKQVSTVFKGTVKMLVRRLHHVLRSAGIGTVVGILPGAGADIGAWVSFAASKRFSKKPEEYGRGSIEGIGDATAANNAALAGAWVPALVFGIPGDSVTAIVLGVLMMKNVIPGPLIFEERPELLYSIYVTFLAANLVMLPLGYLAIRTGRKIVQVPRHYLLPAILLFCIVGAFAINNSIFDIGVMLVMGVVGFFLERYGFPIGPVVLGIVLGPMVEKNLMVSLSKSAGDPSEFVTRGVAGTLGALTLCVWLAPLAVTLIRRLRRGSESAAR